MVSYKPITAFVSRLRTQKQRLLWVALIAFVTWGLIYPQRFFDLWLTRDQQGQILFHQGHYAEAANRHSSAQWQAYSFYGAQKFKQAAILYSQYSDVDSLMAQANALAHASEYVNARNLYREIVKQDPDHQGAQHNLKIVQALIDDINRMSESQRPEGNSKALGDEPQRGDGAEKKETRVQELEQYTSEQLLLDSALNQMWLRQVQKDPANFLSQKFSLQRNQKRQQAVESEGLENASAEVEP
ncbi:MAG: hypothetical protein CL693_03425 [Cellvibrionaceae bacterium]|mgnify:CR=1 FL=1|nr:hypothetical protein [Cellvibrionaceae bacterium]